MKLIIDRIAKIEKAELEMNGITVIAGENGTGKSTIGKILYSIFGAQYNIAEKLLYFRKDAIKKAIHRASIHRTFKTDISGRLEEISTNLINYSENNTVTLEYIYELLIKEEEKELFLLKDNIDLEDCMKEIFDICNLSADDVEKTILNEYFSKEFSNQINHVNDSNQEAHILLHIKGKEINIGITNDEVNYFNKEFAITSDVIYIDSPFIIDEIDTIYVGERIITNHKVDLSKKIQVESPYNNIILETIGKKRIENILKLLNDIVPGEMQKERFNSVVKMDNMEKPINISNLSSGIKTFLLIKTILKNGHIRDKSVLILDEPEIHLHPKWQIYLAELLVLLQKEFDLTLVISTHSPYFINAIEVYSAKHTTADRCKYYLAIDNGMRAYIQDVTLSTDRIYRILADPFGKLEDIKYEGV